MGRSSRNFPRACLSLYLEPLNRTQPHLHHRSKLWGLRPAVYHMLMYVLPHHKMCLNDRKRCIASLDIVQTAAMIFCSGWPRSAGPAQLGATTHNHPTPRGRRLAEPHEHNLDPTCTPTQTHEHRPCDNYLPTFFGSEILSDLPKLCAYYNTTTIASSA